MKVHKFLKVFSLVVILHMALVVMLVLQPGCGSVDSGDTVSMATPVGDSGYSNLWVTDKNQKSVVAERKVKAVNKNIMEEQDFVSSNVAYSEVDTNESFVDLQHAEFQTAAVYAETGEHFEYTVQKGDSLWKIANANGVSMRKVMEANGLKETDPIHPGQSLLIPGKAKPEVALAQLTVPSVEETPKVESKKVEKAKTVVAKTDPVVEPAEKIEPVVEKKETVLAHASLSPAALVEDSRVDDEEGGIYQVAPGDSLYLIAMHNNTTIEEIRALNGLEKNLIRPGQKLRIPGKYKGPMELPEKKDSTASFAVAFNDVPVENAGADYLQHEVQPGEYPGLIARKYNMSLADLLHINDISNPRMLKVGTKLNVINPDAMMKSNQVAGVEKKSDEAVASNGEPEVTEAEEAVSTINFEDFPVIRVGS